MIWREMAGRMREANYPRGKIGGGGKGKRQRATNVLHFSAGGISITLERDC